LPTAKSCLASMNLSNNVLEQALAERVTFMSRDSYIVLGSILKDPSQIYSSPLLYARSWHQKAPAQRFAENEVYDTTWTSAWNLVNHTPTLCTVPRAHYNFTDNIHGDVKKYKLTCFSLFWKKINGDQGKVIVYMPCIIFNLELIDPQVLIQNVANARATMTFN